MVPRTSPLPQMRLARLGKVVCDGLGIEGLGFRRVVERLVRSEARPTTTEATGFVGNAVRNLCPAQASAVPACCVKRADFL